LTDGYSGADIKAICERSARRPFLESIEGAAPRSIHLSDLVAVVAETPRSVTGKELQRFEKWRLENQ
jgi:SpoVK/Ycf46/Vps4 family AAA+-type ATPase